MARLWSPSGTARAAASSSAGVAVNAGRSSTRSAAARSTATALPPSTTITTSPMRPRMHRLYSIGRGCGTLGSARVIAHFDGDAVGIVEVDRATEAQRAEVVVVGARDRDRARGEPGLELRERLARGREAG